MTDKPKLAEVVALAPREGRTVDNALERVKESNLIQCFIVGLDADGEFVYIDSGISNRDSLWLAERAKDWIMRGE